MYCLGNGSIYFTLGGDRNLVGQIGEWQCTRSNDLYLDLLVSSSLVAWSEGGYVLFFIHNKYYLVSISS